MKTGKIIKETEFFKIKNRKIKNNYKNGVERKRKVS